MVDNYDHIVSNVADCRRIILLVCIAFVMLVWT